MGYLLNTIVNRYGYELRNASPLAGGDINSVLLLRTSSENIVIKLNNATAFPGMFEAEKKGLNLLASSESFRIPKIIGEDIIEENSYILLEYIRPGDRKKTFWEDFGQNLAKLHSRSNPDFGCDHSNYIGSLPQQNKWCKLASEFYINERLEPQFRLASKNGFSFDDMEPFFTSISKIIPDEQPSLIHGDLWNGNYLVSEGGDPVLIDPAVAYSIREMEFAMMQLFGGFPELVYRTYNEIFPLEEGWQERIKLFQLYYLLVHLNIFGSGYLSQVRAAMKPYF